MALALIHRKAMKTSVFRESPAWGAIPAKIEAMVQIAAYVELGFCWVAWSLAFVKPSKQGRLDLVADGDRVIDRFPCRDRDSRPRRGTPARRALPGFVRRLPIAHIGFHSVHPLIVFQFLADAF